MPIFKRSDKAETAVPEEIVIDPNVVQLGDRTVKVRKIPIDGWIQLTGVINSLPELVMGVISAPEGSRTAYLFAILEHALEDIVQVVSVLTEFEPEWIKANVAPDELMAYFTAVARVNNFGGLLKNVQGALQLANLQTGVAEASAE